MRLCAIMITLLLTACGGANGSGNIDTNAPDNSAGAEGFGDEHGKKTAVGEKDLGQGYKLQLSSVEGDLKSEAVYELTVHKDGKALSDANVTIWLGDDAGFELTPIAPCLWMEDAQAFDCHIMLPPDGAPEGARVWVRVRHNEFDSNKVEFPYTQ